MKKILSTLLLFLFTATAQAGTLQYINSAGQVETLDIDALVAALASKASSTEPVFTVSPSAPGYLSTESNGNRRLDVNNTVAFTGTPVLGEIRGSSYLTPNGLYRYNGSIWEPVGAGGSDGEGTIQAADPTVTGPFGKVRATGSGDTFWNSTAGLWNESAGTYAAWPIALLPPTAYSITSGTSGPQFFNITFPEAVTASTNADLCDDFSVSMAVAGSLTLGYSAGSGTPNIVCTIAQDVFSTDTFTAPLSYTPGTIVNGSGGALPAITDASSLAVNNSTEEFSAGACGASTILQTDSFSGNLAAFSQVGTWGINSGFTSPTSLDSNIRYLHGLTELNPECQWVQTYKQADGDGYYPLTDIVLRSTGSTGYRYVIEFRAVDAENTTVTWSVYNGTTVVENVQSTTLSTGMAGTIPITAQVRGTGNNTVIDVWKNVAGNGPSTMGSPIFAFTNNPTTPVDAGNFAGIASLDYQTPVLRYTAYYSGN